MSFTVIIPARLASSRLPNKPLADIAGKPMIVRVAEQAQQSGAAQVVVATDAAIILDAVSAAGFATVLTRADHPSGSDRLAEAVDLLRLPDDAIIVNVQGDEPLIEPALIAQIAQHLAQHPEWAMASACHAIHNSTELINPNSV